MLASDLLRALVRLPSLSHAEAEAAAFVEATGRAAGLRVWRDDDNVVLELGSTEPGARTLLFNSHLDVVPPSATMPHGAFDGYEADGTLWGRGTTDAKASGAAMLAALLGLHADGFGAALTAAGGRVLVALTACEETGGGYNGMQALRPKLPALAGAVVGEPTDLHPCVAQKGLLILNLEAHGRTAHAARAHLGDNAVTKLARALVALDSLAFDRTDAHLGAPTLTATMVQGGTAKNVVPDHAAAVLDVRLPPAYTAPEMTALVQAAAAAAAPGVRVTVHSDRYVPCRTPADSAILAAALAAHPDGVPFGSPTASDWVFLADVPAVKMGPGHSERSHTPDERVELADVERAATVYAALARAFFAG